MLLGLCGCSMTWVGGLIVDNASLPLGVEVEMQVLELVGDQILKHVPGIWAGALA